MGYWLLVIGSPIRTGKRKCSLDLGSRTSMISWHYHLLWNLLMLLNAQNKMQRITMKNQLYIFPGGSDGKVSAYNVGDLGSILGWEDLLEKAMATHSSILAWKIPWTEEPGGLQSMGSQRVRYDWATSLSLSQLSKHGKYLYCFNNTLNYGI